MSSKIAEHANNTGHDFDFNNAKAILTERNYHQRIFLEAWHSELDNKSGNFRTIIPAIYKKLLDSCKTARANHV